MKGRKCKLAPQRERKRERERERERERGKGRALARLPSKSSAHWFSAHGAQGPRNTQPPFRERDAKNNLLAHVLGREWHPYDVARAISGRP